MTKKDHENAMTICARRTLESSYGPVSVWITVPREETETGDFLNHPLIMVEQTAR